MSIQKPKQSAASSSPTRRRRAGDRVLFGKWSGTEVKLDGEDLMIMKEADIMGLIDPSVAQKKAA